MITYRGQPEKSVCPYCAATVKTFSQCFIATSVYGDPCCDQVRELRKFRDTKLQTNSFGRVFVRAYYSFSPPIADWLDTKPATSGAIRKVLDGVVSLVRSSN
ncbi:CFI-box-CTERM domain-containing protein [Vibrio diabolicus]|uniref:CFI-box-CTERM domain-containing protein n=1 Tax=Vibrio diabolicus TaxID=50719 RepID=UPI003A5C87AD